MSGVEATEAAQQRLAQTILAAYPFDGRASSLPEFDPAGWPAVAMAAARHGLAPLLYAALKAGGRLDQLPPKARERLRTAYLLTSTANWLAYQDLGRLLDALQSERIPVILLKGCAVAATLYPEVALRPMGDLDLLIHREALNEVAAALAGQDYAPMQEMAGDFGSRYLQEQIFVRGGTRPAQVDAHWHLTSMPYFRQRIPIEWFWEHSAEQPVNGRPAQVLGAEAQLLHLSLHFALQHRAERMVWSYDLALLLARYGATMDWAMTAQAIERFGLTWAVRSSLEQVRAVWNIAPPLEATARLQAIRPGPAERVLVSVMTSRWREARVVSDGLSLPGLRPKLGYWLGLFFPSRAYMRQRYGVRSGMLLPLAYAWRGLTGLFQLARSAFHIGVGVFRARASN